ncbi:hypothetical protein JCM11641_002378 [Rhodosporidiobolus odoratus]
MAPITPSDTTATTSLVDQSGRYAAWVTVDGQAVPVYKVEHTSSYPPKTTCYIECAEGQQFQVVMENRAYYGGHLAFWLHVDGTRMDGFSIKQPHQPGTSYGKRISATDVRPYVFSQVSLTDDAELATTDEKVIKGLGTVRVEVHRTKLLGQTPLANDFADDAKQHVVDERSKKATMSHSTSFGAAVHRPVAGHSDSVQYIDPEDSPGAILEFKYRSRALLELDGIVEPAPVEDASSAPAASTSSGKKRAAVALDAGSGDEEASLRAKVAKVEAENAALKKVKKEPASSKVKKEKPVVLDLCDDSD